MKCHKKDQAVIASFSGDFAFLSNFYVLPRSITYQGISYPTVEHGYQAAKTLDKDERLRISLLPTAAKSKYAGRKIEIREDWEKVKLKIMRILVRKKFEIPELRALLLATGEAHLIEGNWWGDTYWGVCNGVGHNHLGKILMKVREQISRKSKDKT